MAAAATYPGYAATGGGGAYGGGAYGGGAYGGGAYGGGAYGGGAYGGGISSSSSPTPFVSNVTFGGTNNSSMAPQASPLAQSNSQIPRAAFTTTTNYGGVNALAVHPPAAAIPSTSHQSFFQTYPTPSSAVSASPAAPFMYNTTTMPMPSSTAAVGTGTTFTNFSPPFASGLTALQVGRGSSTPVRNLATVPLSPEYQPRAFHPASSNQREVVVKGYAPMSQWVASPWDIKMREGETYGASSSGAAPQFPPKAKRVEKVVKRNTQKRRVGCCQ